MSASGKSDYHCKIKETLFTQEFKPTLNYQSNPWQVVTLLICPRYFKSHPDLSLFLLYLNSFSKSMGYFLLQHTKSQVGLFELHCFTMFITALCVIFLYATLMAEEQESVWQCAQISTHETLRKNGDNKYFMTFISLPKSRTKIFT